MDQDEESKTWFVIQNDDYLMRFNNLPNNLSAEYPLRMGIAIPVNISVETNAEMQELEIFIEEVLGEMGILIAVVTASNFKEFVFYVKENLDCKKLHEDTQTAFPNYEIQMYSESDPEWYFFQQTKAEIDQ